MLLTKEADEDYSSSRRRHKQQQQQQQHRSNNNNVDECCGFLRGSRGKNEEGEEGRNLVFPSDSSSKGRDEENLLGKAKVEENTFFSSIFLNRPPPHFHFFASPIKADDDDAASIKAKKRGRRPPWTTSSYHQLHHRQQQQQQQQQQAKDEKARNLGFIRHSVLFLTCLCLYWNSLEADFAFDDVTAVRDNRDLRPQTPLKNLFANDFWGTPMSKEKSHKSYRPLTVLTFRWNYAVGGLNPVGYHLVNVVLHAVVTSLFCKVAENVVGSKTVAWTAAVLFAVHPIHTEAVTGVVGRAELLASLWFLMAVLTYSQSSTLTGGKTRWRMMFSTVSFAALAMLSKEQGITVFAVCVAQELISLRRKLTLTSLGQLARRVPVIFNSCKRCSSSFQRLCSLAGAALGLLLVRLKVMGAKLPVFTRFDNPAAASESPVRQLTFNYLLGVNSWLLLSPADLCCDWTMNTVPLVKAASDPRNCLTLAFYAVFFGLVKLAWTSKGRLNDGVVFSLALMVFPFLPASNLFFPVGFVVAERVLYLPSMGFSLCVAIGFQLILRRLRRSYALLWRFFLLCAIIFHCSKTLARNLDWKDELTLFSSGLKVAEGNAKMFNNVGHAFEAKEDFDTALKYFQHAASVQPDDIGAYINVGRTLNSLKRYKEAERVYLKAKNMLPKPRPGESYHARVAPNHLNVFLNLASLISRNGSRLEEADSLYRQVISMRADYTQAYINRGDILIKMNKTKEAQRVYEQALTLEADNADLLYNMGVVLLNQNKVNEALFYLDKALEVDPDHPQALINSAILIQESGAAHLHSTAVERLQKVIDKGGGNDRVFFNMGMLAMDKGDWKTAEEHFKQAVKAKPDFRSALFNLALLYSESGRSLEGEPYLRQLIAHHPDHVKGLILMGDLYVNHLNDLRSAQKCYEHILTLDPGNVQGKHNLCVVHVQSGRLKEARECLLEAVQLAPNEEYIRQHLSIVEDKLRQAAKD